jgi:hypothetical protein
MKRIYEQRGYIGRLRFSTGVLLFAAAYGVWELWAGATNPEGPSDILFGVLFIGAAAFGFARLMRDSGNVIAALDRDEAGDRLVVTCWRPWGTRTIAGPLSAFANWRFHISIMGRNLRVYVLRVDHAEVKGPLTIELKPGTTPLDELRALAPGAIADFEEAVPPPPPPAPAEKAV